MSADEIAGAKMKAGDFRPCAICRKGMMNTGLPLFYRVTVQRMGINMREARGLHHMEQYFEGAVGLARALHDPDLAKPITEEYTALVCESCSMEPHMLAQLIETAQHQAEKAKADKAA